VVNFDELTGLLDRPDAMEMLRVFKTVTDRKRRKYLIETVASAALFGPHSPIRRGAA
jgi:hypothetical protein